MMYMWFSIQLSRHYSFRHQFNQASQKEYEGLKSNNIWFLRRKCRQINLKGFLENLFSMWLLFWSRRSHNHPKQLFSRLNHVSLVPQCKGVVICLATSWQVLSEEVSVSCDSSSSAAETLSRTQVWAVQWHFPVEKAHNIWELNPYSHTFSLEQWPW